MADASSTVAKQRAIQDQAHRSTALQRCTDAPRIIQRGKDEGGGDTVADVEQRERAAKLLLQARIRAWIEGERVRRQVRVSSPEAGVVHTRIRERQAGEATLADPTSSLGRIQSHLHDDSEYNRLRILGGASQGTVIGPGEAQGPREVSSFSAGLPQGTAVINGGFFAHKGHMRSEENAPVEQVSAMTPDQDPATRDYLAWAWQDKFAPVGPEGEGRPVGATAGRTDDLPIPSEYADVYGQLTVGGSVGLSSGPMLMDRGQKPQIPFDENRFKYRLDVGDGAVEDNPRNDKVGAMTHAGDKNARAAISIVDGDTLMHTVVPPEMKSNTGATMQDWQEITAAATRGSGSTLNLDGGGSVYMGVVGEQGLKPIAKGQRPEELTERKVGNVVASVSPGAYSFKK